MSINFTESLAYPFKGKGAAAKVFVGTLIIFICAVIDFLLLKLNLFAPYNALVAYIITFFLYMFVLGYVIIAGQEIINNRYKNLPEWRTNFKKYFIHGFKSMIATLAYSMGIFFVLLFLFISVIIAIFFISGFMGKAEELFILFEKHTAMIYAVLLFFIVFLTISIEAFISVVYADRLFLKDCFNIRQTFGKMFSVLFDFSFASFFVFILFGVIFLLWSNFSLVANTVSPPVFFVYKAFEAFLAFTSSLMSINIFSQAYKSVNKHDNSI